MSMSKKDYEAAAKIVRAHHGCGQSHRESEMIVSAVQNAFESLFRQDNAKFDASRFREACNKTEKK